MQTKIVHLTEYKNKYSFRESFMNSLGPIKECRAVHKMCMYCIYHVMISRSYNFITPRIYFIWFINVTVGRPINRWRLSYIHKFLVLIILLVFCQLVITVNFLRHLAFKLKFNSQDKSSIFFSSFVFITVLVVYIILFRYQSFFSHFATVQQYSKLFPS